jgi:ABC-2 type transport system ATP-binding protein
MVMPRIEAVDLGKSYGPVTALTRVTLRVGAGTVLGVLGHNGAGKTTLIDILATRALPSAGRAAVCGFDVVRFGQHVRRHIGMAGQFVAVDEAMSGWDNLILIARLLGASRRQARERAGELLDSFGLVEAAGRRVATYSGGMRRRLDLAMSLLGRPQVLFLDEPTTGLDPVSRTDLWGFVERLAGDGTTVVLTTQYLDEADRLADSIVVLAAGSVVASGSPASLKAGVGRRTAVVRFADPAATVAAETALSRLGLRPLADPAGCLVRVPVAGAGEIVMLVRTLDSVVDLTVAEPTLDDVYLALYRASWSPLWRTA